MYGMKIPESVVRAVAERFPGGFQPGSGTYMQAIRDTMRELGMNARLSEQVLVDDLAQVTSQGRPAVAGITWPDGTGHAIVVEGFSAGPVGARMVSVRDPATPSLGPQEWHEGYFRALFNPPHPSGGITYGTAVGLFQ
jgi:hypothetical protein